MHSNRSIDEGGKDRGLSLGDGRVEARNGRRSVRLEHTVELREVG